MNYFAATTMVIFLANAASAETGNPCVDFFNNSQRDIRTVDSDAAAFNYAHSQLCRDITQTRALSGSLGLIINKAPINFDGKSDQQRVETFCSFAATQSWSRNILSGREENIVRESFQSFNACMGIYNDRTAVTQTYGDPTGIVVKFDNSESRVVNVLGLQIGTQTNLACSLIRAGEAQTSLDGTTPPTRIEGRSFAVSCTRKPLQIGDKKIFDRETVILTTDISRTEPLPIVMPGRVIEGTEVETQKDAQIAHLNRDLMRMRQQLGEEIGKLTPIQAKSYVLTSNLALPVPSESVRSVRDLRSADLEPTAPCDGVRPWASHLAPAATKLCSREGLVLKGEITPIFTAGGGCGRTAFLVTCATR